MKNHSNLSRFVYSFLVTALLFGGLFAYYYHVLMTQNMPTEITLTNVSVPQFTAKDNISFLFIYDADLSGQNVEAVVISLRASDKTVTSCPLDMRTDSLANATHLSLAAHYRLRSINGLKNAVENLLQCHFTAYIRCDKMGLTGIMQSAGNIRLSAGDIPEITEDVLVNGGQLLTLWEDNPSAHDVLFHRLLQACMADRHSIRRTLQVIYRDCDTDYHAYRAENDKNAVLYLTEKAVFRRMTQKSVPVQMGAQTIYAADAASLSALMKVVR